MPLKIAGAGTTVSGAGNIDVVAAGTRVLVFALGIHPAAAGSLVTLTDASVTAGTNNRWSLSAVANGTSTQKTFNPPLVMPSGMRITVSGAAALGYVQWAKAADVGL